MLFGCLRSRLWTSVVRSWGAKVETPVRQHNRSKLRWHNFWIDGNLWACLSLWKFPYTADRYLMLLPSHEDSTANSMDSSLEFTGVDDQKHSAPLQLISRTTSELKKPRAHQIRIAGLEPRETLPPTAKIVSQNYESGFFTREKETCDESFCCHSC